MRQSRSRIRVEQNHNPIVIALIENPIGTHDTVTRADALVPTDGHSHAEPPTLLKNTLPQGL